LNINYDKIRTEYLIFYPDSYRKEEKSNSGKRTIPLTSESYRGLETTKNSKAKNNI